MEKPTAKELHQASLNGGRLPESYFKRIGVNPEKVKPKPRGTEVIEPDPETDETEKANKQAQTDSEPASQEAAEQQEAEAPQSKAEPASDEPSEKQPEQSEWPKKRGGGWWQVSTGKKTQGEEQARAWQAEIDAK